MLLLLIVLVIGLVSFFMRVLCSSWLVVLMCFILDRGKEVDLFMLVYVVGVLFVL